MKYQLIVTVEVDEDNCGSTIIDTCSGKRVCTVEGPWHDPSDHPERLVLMHEHSGWPTAVHWNEQEGLWINVTSHQHIQKPGPWRYPPKYPW